jgi:type VI secretion system secreted protein Hcp
VDIFRQVIGSVFITAEDGLRRKSMAVDVFMKIDGISGESSDLQFKDWIEVLSLNWEVTRPMDQASGQVKHVLRSAPFGIIKAVDKATPQIFKAVTSNEDIEEIQLALCRAGKERVKYLTYVFKNCVITKAAVQMSNNAGESLPTEDIRFRFASVEITYFQQKRETGGSGGQISHKWNFSEWE